MDVSIIGWNMGLNKVGLTKLLMRECAMELSAARSLVKSIVKSDAVTVVVPDEALNGFLVEVFALGAKARVLR